MSENYKGRLQEYCQKNGYPLPSYKLSQQFGPDHNRYFISHCQLWNGEVIAGEGSSRKLSEHDAARNALEDLLQSSIEPPPPTEQPFFQSHDQLNYSEDPAYTTSLESEADFTLSSGRVSHAPPPATTQSSFDVVENKKGALQEFCAKQGLMYPKYELLERSGPDHKPVFVVQVTFGGTGRAFGLEATKKKAEHNAAAHALEYLRHRTEPPSIQQLKLQNASSSSTSDDVYDLSSELSRMKMQDVPPSSGLNVIELEKNPKGELQTFCSRNGLSAPLYYPVARDGPVHDPTFHVKVIINDKEFPGSGKTKKLAEKVAAIDALKRLALSSHDNSSSHVNVNLDATESRGQHSRYPPPPDHINSFQSRPDRISQHSQHQPRNHQYNPEIDKEPYIQSHQTPFNSSHYYDGADGDDDDGSYPPFDDHHRHQQQQRSQFPSSSQKQKPKKGYSDLFKPSGTAYAEKSKFRQSQQQKKSTFPHQAPISRNSRSGQTAPSSGSWRVGRDDSVF